MNMFKNNVDNDISQSLRVGYTQVNKLWTFDKQMTCLPSGHLPWMEMLLNIPYLYLIIIILTRLESR